MTFDEIIAQMTEAVAGIRKAIYGVQVREYIAQGMENVLAVARLVIDSTAAAKASEENAALSAANAKNSETAASSSAAASKASAEDSALSASEAKTGEKNAKDSETAAKSSENAAKASADRAAAIVSTDKTMTVDGAPADAKIVGDALAAAKLETDGKLDKLKKSISEKGRLIGAGSIFRGKTKVMPDETDYLVLKFASNTYYTSSSYNGKFERNDNWPEEGFVVARGGTARLPLTSGDGLDENTITATFGEDGTLTIESTNYLLIVNWEAYKYI